ncbi:MAG TPA: alkaline phosphatase family protein [Thermoanaerobaculia bacterium]|nr:alkaline phosphatase family protein [Thermoanaerobaculia bacterium]
MSDVDSLRAQLRERGYLTHGIERWFALDPWSSRAFWLELITVALKAATLIAAFGALPLAAVMAFRNYPLHAFETLGLFVSYAAVWLVAAFAFVVAVALILKLRPAIPIDTPRALLAISLAAGALLTAPIAIWWYRFDAAPTLPELLAGVALCAIFFLAATTVVSAALLSFSIYELQRVPAIHQKPRGVPMAIAAAVLIALLFAPAYADRERTPIAPMVVTTPTTTRVALIAVDGLTNEILQSRRDLLPHLAPIQPIAGSSTTERWASLGTGVHTEHHGVRAIEGVRFRGSAHVLQRISRGDFVLMTLAPLARVARREPLPPTVRRRDYVWEIFAERGVTSISVNWWATADAANAIGPESIFTSAQGDPLRVDAIATARFIESIDQRKPRFATVYLPALDVILNRIELDPAAKVASSLRALDGITIAVTLARARGYEVVVAGMPGEGQRGAGVIASTMPLRARTAWDIAPAILTILGFPASSEMPGGEPQSRIATYGPRETDAAASASVNEEYYENLKSLGYIR